MNKWVYLSYPLNSATPAYGGGNAFKTWEEKNIEKGDSCNAQYWCLPNHLGTHIDFPRHFAHDGKTARDYPAEFWIFDFPLILDLSPVAQSEIIQAEDVSLVNAPESTDLLIIKTGFSLCRKEDVYYKNNPGFDPELAAFLRERFPNLKVFGFDSISLSSFANRETGRKAHKAFLDHTRPILLLEDMNLSMVDGGFRLKRIIVSPLRVEDADASPCTVFAEVIE